ncbi:MAG TPA: helix-turn-helix domain-containing protein [Solirubrobacteraceae bacterium]|nr:helix-turn-helix domain-containing protein [Solirubrobacteraceae bacterium]
MPRKKRTYGDVCGIARALDLVGERWSLMIVRELLLGPKRFTDLRAGLPGVGPDVLSQRMRDLAAEGLVDKRKLPPPIGAQVYELTELGRRLEPVVMALGEFGSHLPVPTGPGLRMSFDAHILSLRTLFAADRADGFTARVELRLDGGPVYRALVDDGELVLEQGGADVPDVIITGDPGELLGVAHGRLPLADTALQIDGDHALGERFLTLFPLPEPAIAVVPAALLGP